jgi:hypothetical protein
MKLPNFERAIVDIEKLRNYCLSPEHPRGRNKARVFKAVLGLTDKNAEELRNALLSAARTNEVVPAEADEYGQRYVLDFVIKGTAGWGQIRSSWIIRKGEDFPRLTTCYVL